MDGRGGGDYLGAVAPRREVMRFWILDFRFWIAGYVRPDSDAQAGYCAGTGIKGNILSVQVFCIPKVAGWASSDHSPGAGG